MVDSTALQPDRWLEEWRVDPESGLCCVGSDGDSPNEPPGSTIELNRAGSEVNEQMGPPRRSIRGPSRARHGDGRCDLGLPNLSFVAEMDILAILVQELDHHSVRFVQVLPFGLDEYDEGLRRQSPPSTRRR